jgi:shikimate kinase
MPNLIFIGMKNSGKSTISRLVAQRLEWRLLQLDELIENFYAFVYGRQLTFRQIHQTHGAEFFRRLENNLVQTLAELPLEDCVLDCGGGTALEPKNAENLKKLGSLIWLKLEPKINYERLTANGIPAFFAYPNDPQSSFEELIQARFPVYEQIADEIWEYSTETAEDVVEKCFKMQSSRS